MWVCAVIDLTLFVISFLTDTTIHSTPYLRAIECKLSFHANNNLPRRVAN